MTRFSLRVLTLCFMLASLLAAPFADISGAEEKALPKWPSFRGIAARGWDDTRETPSTWNLGTKENVRWKIRLPGLGLSSPVIWGDRVFVTTAISAKDNANLRVGLYGDIAPAKDDTEHRYVVICLDRQSGKVLWEKVAYKGVPTIQRHTKSSHANSTPATNGEIVVAFFGSEGLYCYEVDGTLRWKKSLGRLDSGYFAVPGAQWGFGSSPVIYKDRVIVLCDVQKGSFLAAYSLKTGDEIWRTERKDVPTWGTPTVVEHGGRTQVVVNGYQHSGGYDIDSGKKIWKLSGGGDIPVPTPVAWKNLVFLTSAHGQLSPIYAIRLDAKGTIRLEPRKWKHDFLAWGEQRGGNYMQTPLVYRDLFFSCRDNGVMSCYEPDTGDRQFRQRLGGGRSGFTASPVASGGKIYFTSEDGDVFVVAAKNRFELLATNSLNEVAMATPAIADGALFFRTRRHVICIAGDE